MCLSRKGLQDKYPFRVPFHAGAYWLRLGPFRIEHVRDLTGDGVDTATPDGKPQLPTSSSHMLTYSFANGCDTRMRSARFFLEFGSTLPVLLVDACFVVLLPAVS